MAQFPFVGPSYTYSSRNFDAQRCVNLYPIVSESGTSKKVSALVGTPGLKLFCTLASNKVRGAHEVLGRAFEVAGNTLYEIFEDGTSDALGTIDTLTGPVSMADNGVELIIVDGPDGWILTLADDNFAQITDPDWEGADTVCFVDGYFIFSKPDTGQYYLTGLYDGATIDALDFATAEGATDNLVAVAAVHGQLMLLGSSSIEWAANTGAADFPFQRISGAFIEYGCAAAFSVGKIANSVIWLGKDKQGQGVVWMATGYQPERLSTDAVEQAIQGYDSIDDAVAYTYQKDGHHFYVLNFTQADTTWVCDLRTKLWHERSFFNTETGLAERHRGQAHIFAFGKHLVGDYDNGNVYELSETTYTDNGTLIRRERSCPHLKDDGDLNFIYYNSFQLDMETGIGLESGEDPQVVLQWSDDGGHTWSNEYWVSAGKIGQYLARARWRRLGRSRDRVFRVRFSAACKVFWMGAHVDAVRGAN
jgi:hypothetical protein